MINTDSYYEIGAGHVFNQDYAKTGFFLIGDKKFRYAVVSDGCSGVKDPDADVSIGARMLALWFPMAFKYAWLFFPDDLASTIAARIKEFILKDEFNLPLASFDATLVATVYNETDDVLYSFVWGDGKIYYSLKGKANFLIDVNFSSNAPYYLSYLTDVGKEINYESVFGKDYATVNNYLILDTHSSLIVEATKYKQKSFFEKFERASQAMTAVSIFSDGIDTFQKKDDLKAILPKHNVYKQFTQFQSVHGQFVRRRMNAVKKFCQKEGWQHFDDISIATISF